MSDYELDPGFYDEDAQHNPEWMAWVDPASIAAQIDALFSESLASVADGDVPPPADRYTQETVWWVCERFNELFPDVDALYERDNRRAANGFLCYFGEALRALAGGEWFARAGVGSILVPGGSFTPAIGYRWGYDADDITNLLFEAAEAPGGTDAVDAIGDEIYSRSVDYAKAHGIPHDFDEVRRKHGLM
ncbi:hypothetical protein D7D52_24875 [Nocardia yunnanensis]|uniref:Uncharacterized protein n=1 Tax=Nocardia yunnanensis TaxID=2382165 RepID=A0A386ZIX2_9NOCA|nr:hypothetical protein [Nocardia yunnanensis]AYF76515.1 hypothetical protein D7D52_24875 [Nocardia yunnanensis]